MTEQRSLFATIPTLPCLPDMPKSKQGQQAVRSGLAAEATIYCILKERGYTVHRQVEIGDSLKGGRIRADFLVMGIPAFPSGLAIESKWQEVAGTADEKLFGLAEDIDRRYPCPTIVVVGGGGARQPIVDWLRNQVNGGKLYAVFSLEEFLAWVIRNL